MAWYQWAGVFWVVCGVVVLFMLNWAQRHAPMDPSEGDEDTFPEAWSWPERDESAVRHPGLKR